MATLRAASNSSINLTFCFLLNLELIRIVWSKQITPKAFQAFLLPQMGLHNFLIKRQRSKILLYKPTLIHVWKPQQGTENNLDVALRALRW